MTTETTKPSVITAAQFVADGYAAKVAAGDVIARGTTGERITRIRVSNDPDWKLEAFYPDEISSKVWWGLTGDCPIDLEWLYPTDDATPATDELASLRAANARYRAALEDTVAALQRVYPQAKGALVIQDIRNAIDKGLDALAETEEA